MVSSDRVHRLMMGYCCFVSCYLVSNLLLMHSSCYSFVMGHSRLSLMGNSMHRL